MLLDDEVLRQIEDALVSATLRPEAWSAAVAQIVKYSGSHGAAALPLRGRVPGVPLSPSCEGLIATYFDAGWAERDHRVKGIPKLMQTGLFVDQDISTPDFVRTSSFYNDFLGRLGFRWFAGLLVAVGDDAWCLTLQRTPEQGPFTPDEQGALRRMIAPLSRTARFAQTMGEARLHGVADALQALRVAGLLLDRTGRAIHVNARAEHLLGRDLDLTQDGLTVPGDRRATAAIRSHISAAIWSELRPDDPALESVRHHIVF